MGDYFRHWISIGENAPDKSKLPRLFNVNWFRKNAEGKYIWPGYGDNVRVLKWIFERLDGAPIADKTPIGFVPKEGTIDLQGLENVDIKDIIKIDKNKWLAELELIKTHYNVFGDRLPSELRRQFAELEKRLNNA
jgi:phosphoenolpyruvate carboxykinase (GTP)